MKQKSLLQTTTYFAALLCFTLNTATAQTEAAKVPVKKNKTVATQASKWNGYSKQSFVLAERSAFVVAPKVTAPGNPWVWRTSFPNYHAEVDLELLYNGYHIGYIDVVKMLGSDSSLDLMDKFYDQVRHQWKLAEKPAFEAVSRGGLHAYRYAARHPDRIACIYADTPVMDLKSWPMKRAEAKQQLNDAIKFYEFGSLEKLKAFQGNPVDLMETVAGAKIPLRHVICLADKVVPPEQNTLEANRRLKLHGHYGIDLVTVEKSDQLEGHHFPLPEVFQSARFIMQHARVVPRDIEYFELRNGLANCKKTFESTKKGRIVFLGGSITHGRGWRNELMRYFEKRFPETKFDFIAAGIPSVGSNGHAFRLQRDVLMRGPVDLLFVESAVNDGTNIPDQPEIMLRATEGLVHQIRKANPSTDIIQMHFAAGEQLEAYKAGKTPVPITEHEKVAVHYGCTSLNITKEVADRIEAGEFTWKSGFQSNVHPPPFGQRLYTNSMTRMLDAALATKAPPKAHAIPEKLIDPHSYIQGRFGELSQAVIGKGFSINPKWKPAKGKTRSGFANVPALVASEPGSEFSCEFEGTAFGLFLAAGYDTCVLEFSIDGGEFQQVDSFTRWSKKLHLPWALILADNLKSGTHKIKVRITDQQPKRTALHVIQFLLN